MEKHDAIRIKLRRIDLALPLVQLQSIGPLAAIPLSQSMTVCCVLCVVVRIVRVCVLFVRAECGDYVNVVDLRPTCEPVPHEGMSPVSPYQWELCYSAPRHFDSTCLEDGIPTCCASKCAHARKVVLTLLSSGVGLLLCAEGRE